MSYLFIDCETLPEAWGLSENWNCNMISRLS